MSYSTADLDEAKQHIRETFSDDEQRALKQFADLLRRPMNRKQRRALAAHARRVGR